MDIARGASINGEMADRLTSNVGITFGELVRAAITSFELVADSMIAAATSKPAHSLSAKRDDV